MGSVLQIEGMKCTEWNSFAFAFVHRVGITSSNARLAPLTMYRTLMSLYLVLPLWVVLISFSFSLGAIKNV